MKIFSVLAALLVGIAACDGDWDGSQRERQRYLDDLDREWNGPCADTATLLATTSGSPSDQKCTNKLHRMRVQISSGPSGREYGAVVLCECQRGAPGPAPADAGVEAGAR